MKEFIEEIINFSCNTSAASFVPEIKAFVFKDRQQCVNFGEEVA